MRKNNDDHKFMVLSCERLEDRIMLSGLGFEDSLLAHNRDMYFNDADRAASHSFFSSGTINATETGSIVGSSAGVTVITHGWQLFGGQGEIPPSWTTEMGVNILRRAGGVGSIFVHDARPAEATFGQWIALDQDPRITEVWNNSNSTADEIVLVYNWVWDSDDTEDGWIQAAADNLFASMLDTPLGIGLDVMQRPLHFIGHSRGAVLNALVTDLIGHYFPSVEIDQVTTLDPHPIDADGVGYEADDPDIFTFDNVRYADNYYRQFGNYQIESTAPIFDFDGIPVPGAHDIELANSVLVGTPPDYLDGGYGDSTFARGEHTDVHLWYAATILPGETFFEGFNISEEETSGWWTADVGYSSAQEPASGRDFVGYSRSRIGGEDRSTFEVTAGSPSDPAVWGWEPVFNGSFRFGAENLFSADELPGWERHGGEHDADYTGQFIHLGESAFSNYEFFQHNLLYFPNNLLGLRFDYAITDASSDDRLAIYVGDTQNPVDLIPLDSLRGGIETVLVGNSYQNSVGTIRFELVSGASIDSDIDVDNIRFVTTIRGPVFPGDAGLGVSPSLPGSPIGSTDGPFRAVGLQAGLLMFSGTDIPQFSQKKQRSSAWLPLTESESVRTSDLAMPSSGQSDGLVGSGWPESREGEPDMSWLLDEAGWMERVGRPFTDLKRSSQRFVDSNNQPETDYNTVLRDLGTALVGGDSENE